MTQTHKLAGLSACTHHMTVIAPIRTPPNAAPRVKRLAPFHPRRPAALGELVEDPAEPEADGEEEVGFEPPDEGVGVKTPPDGS